MTVYLDIVFIENILMNYIILFGCAVIMKINYRKTRILISATLGALYTIAMYLKIIPLYSNIIMKFMLSIVMVFIAYKPNNIKGLLRELIIFYLTSFIFGGCTFGLIYLVNPQLAQIKNGVFVGMYPLTIVIIGGSIAFIIMQISFKFIRKKITKSDMIYRIEISIFERKAQVNALLDTGNLLKEPITGLPVIIVEEKILNTIIPTEIIKNINQIIGGDTSSLITNEELQKYISRFRMIPYSSVGKDNGLLLGVRSDCISIISDDSIETIKNAIIGIYDKSFSKGGQYSAIFGLDLLDSLK